MSAEDPEDLDLNTIRVEIVFRMLHDVDASWPSFVVDVARLAHLKTTVGELTPSLGKGRSTSPWLTRPNMAEAGRYGVPVPFRPAYPFSVLEKFRISQPLVNVVHQLVSRHF